MQRSEGVDAKAITRFMQAATTYTILSIDIADRLLLMSAFGEGYIGQGQVIVPQVAHAQPDDCHDSGTN